MALMEYELARARRYERPLSLAAVSPEAVLSARFPLRFSDLFAQTPDGAWVLVMLPETGGAGASALARRLQESDDAADQIRVVTFPDDGVTLGDLIGRILPGRGAERLVARAS